MKVHYPVNTWTAFVEDCDIRNLTEGDINFLGNLLAEKTVLVFRGQTLSPADEVKFCGQFGDMDQHREFTPQMTKSICIPGFPEISRVTGKLDDEGMPGLHGHKGDLDWHCNKVSNPNRKPIVYLYSLEGSKGSRTSWTNSVFAYADLPANIKKKINDLTMDVSLSFKGYSDLGKIFNLKDDVITPNYHPRIVQKNAMGHTSLYFPFLQIAGVRGLSDSESRDLSDFLIGHMMQDKYLYHHDWEDGDVVISDQWSGLHKRWAFEGMESRLLHRIAMDYSKIKLQV